MYFLSKYQNNVFVLKLAGTMNLLQKTSKEISRYCKNESSLFLENNHR